MPPEMEIQYGRPLMLLPGAFCSKRNMALLAEISAYLLHALGLAHMEGAAQGAVAAVNAVPGLFFQLGVMAFG